jgi:exodeoxyribonuclease V beta subunit
MSTAPAPMVALDLATEKLVNGLVIEASAGTGKTYSVAALVAREIALREELRIGNILITTFTRNAAAELRDRVRRRMVQIADQLDTNSPDDGDAISKFLADDLASRADIIRRLRRAVVEFDTATISTIHAVCNKVLGLAGLSTMQLDGEDATSRLVLEAVNDALVESGVQGHIIAEGNEAHLVLLVKAKLGSPRAELWFDRSSKTVEELAIYAELEKVVTDVVRRVQEKSAQSPSYNDLLRRASEVVTSGKYPTVVQAFKERYALAFVDEAQDTDMLQWDLFTSTFDSVMGEDDRALVTVGDPKQAIYGFRGADVAAYVEHREGKPMRTLAQNQRSDEYLIDGLNALFDQQTFGSEIDYMKVSTPERHAGSAIDGTAPLTLIDIGNITNQGGLAHSVARRVLEILAKCSVPVSSKDTGGARRGIRPEDICVLVGRKAVGRNIERELRRYRVPAVSNGTESVMKSHIALAVRSLLEAMERVSDLGRTRLAVATPFFGHSLTDPEILDDQMLAGWQEQIATWANILRRSGVAALSSAILRDVNVARSLTSTSDAERYLADFAHVMDLLHEYTKGIPCNAAHVLEVFGQLESIEDLSEVVSRRVESDSAAVQIMTVHSAKGLQFPVVIVADLWKPNDGNSQNAPVYTRVMADGQRSRVIDIGWAIGQVDPSTKGFMKAAGDEEDRRLLYVALTRAEHHLSVLFTSGVTTSKGELTPSIFDLCTNVDQAIKLTGKVEKRGVDALGKAMDYQLLSAMSRGQLELANAPASVVQSYRRTSFSGITKRQEGREGNNKAAGFIGEESGQDESPIDMSLLGVGAHQYAANDVPAGLPEGVDMPLARVPGGTYFGRVMHKVYEVVDTSKDLREEVTRAIDIHASSALLRPFRDQLIEGVIASYRTPLGMPFNGKALADIDPSDRLSELDFEMSLPNLSQGVLASDIGKLLKDSLGTNDLLYAYADTLSDSSFDIPLAGLLNGSIDAVIRVHTEDGSPRLFITDYKTNRLDSYEDVSLIEAYAPERLVAAMEHHHYPLQALLYGTAIYRMLRWRQPALNADEVIAGVAYFFVRGMVGVESPKDAHGMPYGVFQWKAPVGLWEKLSNLFAGDRP